MFADNFGIVDNRFLSSTLGSLNPEEPLSLPEEASMEVAIAKLRKHGTGALLITNRGGQLSGIITVYDIVMKLDLERTEQLELPVSHFMTKNPSSAFMTTSIAYGLSMLSQGGFRHIPIVDDDNFPVALISVKDIVDHIVGQLTSDLLALKCDVFGE